MSLSWSNLSTSSPDLVAADGMHKPHYNWIRIGIISGGTLGSLAVADQWGGDTPIAGSITQAAHIDYRNPLFEESPDLVMPPYMLVLSFGLVDITSMGPIEIAPGTHRMPRSDAEQAVANQKIDLVPILMEIGDVLIRHPWALHRGTPNTTLEPRPLLTIRYVRRLVLEWKSTFVQFHNRCGIP